ncbi:hypothetical protein ACQ9AR_09555 [Streptomyces lividans]|uniref:Possible integral membrane protein n=2 Tax=Streptomyces TaxID=1883 RepID=Q9L113_STRCO|nr:MULTISPECIES: hypothetical protein [Streptomyces]MYU40969.1 hypothetical protein [Streptomyces sp. SID7813]EFD70468.1 integral membrane protein [Streptomyces lividans TK24]KKD11779.1 membrane protein [Streptomyces sp. WM6391]MDX2928336.1 hypothetical protein [Streptomyces sp. NRRL_B-16638]NSL84479.1 hypothetical protein [Streptomyces coelicolor]
MDPAAARAVLEVALCVAPAALHEHLLRDFGGAGLALAVMLCAAVATMERRLVLTSPVACPDSSVARLLFHARHLEPLSAGGAAGFMAPLGTAVLLPTVLGWPAADGTAFAEPGSAGTGRRPG